jgi:hypothetical protein
VLRDHQRPGRLDLEASEMAIRAAMHQMGGVLLEKLLNSDGGGYRGAHGLWPAASSRLCGLPQQTARHKSPDPRRRVQPGKRPCQKIQNGSEFPGHTGKMRRTQKFGARQPCKHACHGRYHPLLSVEIPRRLFALLNVAGDAVNACISEEQRPIDLPHLSLLSTKNAPRGARCP